MCKGTKALLLVCAVAVLVAGSVPAWADAVSEKRRAQNKLLAYRAARVDGMRKLAERINGLAITSQTSVKDFVAESDQIETAMQAFLLGASEAGRPTYVEDGTCEVTMQVSLEEVVVTLKRLHQQHYKGNKIAVTDIEKMTVTSNVKVIKAVGMGAPRPELEADIIVPVEEGTLSSISYLSGTGKAYWLAHCSGRGRLMAVRAARVEGFRRLGERIQGVMISSTTSVRDFVAESDQIDVSMAAFIRGARETGIVYHADELIVEVEMSVTLREVLVSLKRWAQQHYKGNQVIIQQMEKRIVEVKEREIRETGMGVPPEKYLVKATAVETVAIQVTQASMKWPLTIRAKGNGALDTDGRSAAQAKLLAYRAAELDARRKLAEKLDGLMISSSTSVRDFVAENDEIETSMLTFQQGAYVVSGSQKLLEDGTAEVTVEIELKPLVSMVSYYRRQTIRR
jgi:hypothetical protein